MLISNKFITRYNERQLRLIDYLKRRVNSDKSFFKAKHIARETGLSSREVGTNMAILSEICPDFSIIKYSYSNSTTWMITTSKV